MQVRLTRKLADVIDGVDLSRHEVGDVFDVPAVEAQLLIAEGWADIHIAEVYKGEFGGSTLFRSRELGDRSRPGDSADPSGTARTLDRIWQVRRELEQRRFARNERRRAEDRFREELRDARARVVRVSGVD
jgi:hypothetical protein